MQQDLEREIGLLVREWNRALMEKDLDTVRRLRDDGYVGLLPGGGQLTREQELALLSSQDLSFRELRLHALEVRFENGEARATADQFLDFDFEGARTQGHYRLDLRLRRSGEDWRVIHSRLEEIGFEAEAAGPKPVAKPLRRLARLLPASARRGIRRYRERVRALGVPPFQQVAYLPYRPGEDWVLPPVESAHGAPAGDLPIPPRELWLGYNYPAHGKLHVEKMVELLNATGFSLGEADRILDLGCGAGRMIRHLSHLADRTEIWGTDISAEHIFWCKQHLSPPFNFAVTTKVPHLPFEDRYFDLIYCGSLFTHIDDLADAWLLELRRVLSPSGRAYVTLHDNRTIEIFEATDTVPIINEIKSSPTYQAAKHAFSAFAVGRDDHSQIFYDRNYFIKMASPMFEVASVTPEAYFYQTAYVLKRRS